jgi:hypothetical protein
MLERARSAEEVVRSLGDGAEQLLRERAGELLVD